MHVCVQNLENAMVRKYVTDEKKGARGSNGLSIAALRGLLLILIVHHAILLCCQPKRMSLKNDLVVDKRMGTCLDLFKI